MRWLLLACLGLAGCADDETCGYLSARGTEDCEDDEQFCCINATIQELQTAPGAIDRGGVCVDRDALGVEGAGCGNWGKCCAEGLVCDDGTCRKW